MSLSSGGVVVHTVISKREACRRIQNQEDDALLRSVFKIDVEVNVVNRYLGMCTRWSRRVKSGGREFVFKRVRSRNESLYDEH